MAYSGTIKRTINAQDVVPVINASPQANTTGNITASAQTIVATDLTGVGSVTVQITGTYVGINMIFEASTDSGTTYFPVNGQNTSTGALTTAGATGVIATNATVVWNVTPLLGFDRFRVRSTAFTSGTGAITIHPSTQFVGLPLATQAVSGTVATTQSTSPWITREGGAATSLTTQVTPATTSTTLKASNAARKRLILTNGGTGDCYIAYNAAASSTAYVFLLPSLGTATINGEEYTGAINGIWTATGGNSMQVTETT